MKRGASAVSSSRMKFVPLQRLFHPNRLGRRGSQDGVSRALRLPLLAQVPKRTSFKFKSDTCIPSGFEPCQDILPGFPLLLSSSAFRRLTAKGLAAGFGGYDMGLADPEKSYLALARLINLCGT